jgi:cohesin loading factor subunit SCC2
MKSALLDSSTSVREATIDLIGRFVLQSKSRELCEKYCDLIGERILDTGVSVRKRVIKILRDICIEFPEYEKNGEICVKIIKRVNDEGEGIRKLVIETCRDLWFQLNESNEEKDILKYKIMSLLHVISVILSDSMTTSIDSLQLLFEQIIKTNEKQLLKSSQIIVDFIVKEILSEEMNRSQEKKVLNLSSIQLLEMLSQINPELLVKHCETLQSLLSLSCDTLVDIHLKVKVIKTLERVLPKLQNPSQLLLLRIEEDLTKNILQSNALILSQSVKCLSVLIKNHTKNEKLSKDLFQKFQQIVLKFNLSEDLSSIPKLLRAIYSSGLFIKYFIKDYESKEIILEKLLKLINESQNEEIICKSIISLGFIIESDPKICLKPKVIQLYERILTNEQMKELFVLKVLNNFRNYLSESQESDELKNKLIEWKSESLKQMSSQSDDESEKVFILYIDIYKFYIN